MASSESHPALQISFSGEPGEVCQTFIDHVTKYAFENDKQDDDEWLADFAGIRLRGPALLWYTEQDDETQGSWRKLRKALVRAYRSSFEATATSYRPSGSSAALTPAAAPALTPATNPSQGFLTTSEPRKGIIRVITEDPEFSGYVSSVLGIRGSIQQTTDPAEAAVVQFLFSNEPHSIQFNVLDQTLFSWMSVQFQTKQPECAPDTGSWGRVVRLAVRAGVLASSTTEILRGKLNAAVWLVLLDGSLVAVHTDKNNVQHFLEMYVAKKTHELSFALVFKNVQAQYAQTETNPVVYKARLVFEAI